MSALSIRRGDILLVRFPFSDFSSGAVRPALVLSNDQHNASDPDIVCLMLTSQADQARPDDFVLRRSDPDFTQSGLDRDSVFRTPRVVALHMGLFRRRLGTASRRVLNEVGRRLKELLGL